MNLLVIIASNGTNKAYVRRDSYIMKKIVLLFVSIMLLLSACQKAPERESSGSVTTEAGLDENVTGNKNDSLVDENVSHNEKKSLDDIEMIVSFDEARNQLENIKGKSFGDIHFPDYYVMTLENQISEFEVSCYHAEDLEILEEQLGKIWDDYEKTDREKSRVQDYTNSERPDYKGESVFSENNEYIYTATSDGMICGNSLDSSWDGYGEIIKSYEIEWGDEIDDSVYELVDGEYSVKAAIAMVEERVNETLLGIEKDFTYKVQHLYVVKNAETDTYDYKMILGRFYGDIPIDTALGFYTYANIDYGKVFRGDGLLAIVHRKDKIDCFNTEKPLINITKLNDYDKIVSPEYAALKAQTEVASVGVGDYDYCGLVYMMEQKSRKNGNSIYAFEYESKVTSYMRPYWVFFQQSEYLPSFNGNGNQYTHAILVDAIDGSLYYFDYSA